MLDLEACWTAVENRDAAADGNFVYAVRTTGVYCRPGCASRLPRRKNVAFYETTAAAEAAGFRPCKRCRPRRLVGERHVAAIEPGLRADPRSETHAEPRRAGRCGGISRFHFHRVFKQITGATPREWGRPTGSAALPNGSMPARTSPRRSTVPGSAPARAPTRRPRRARHDPGSAASRRARRDDPLYDGATGLGWALVAATERGICMTVLGDERGRTRSRAAPALPGCPDLAGRCRIDRLGRADRPLHHRARRTARPAARHPRHRVPGAGVARLAEDPAGRDRDL